MGCSLGISKAKPLQSFHVKPMMNSRMITSDNTDVLSFQQLSPIRLRQKVPACLKINIIPQSPKFCHHVLDLSKTQLQGLSPQIALELSEIKNIYSLYSCSIRNFCDSVHEVCLENFSISSGITIMLISLNANRNATVEYVDASPYIKVLGELELQSKVILERWEKFIKAIEEILKKSIGLKRSIEKLKGFEIILNEYTEFALRPEKLARAKKLVVSASETAEFILGEININQQAIKSFFCTLKKNKSCIDKFSSRAKEMKIFSAEQITHYILS